MHCILVAECKQEVSTFNPVPSQYRDFRVVRHAGLLDYHHGVREEVGGALSVFEPQPDVEIVPALGASANTSGGVLTAEDFSQLSDHFLAAIESAGMVDGAYFCLHGAMQAENENDPEGWLLVRARAILGEAIPFVVSLDLHGILTDRMLTHSAAVVIYHTYPHVDFYETGERAARLLMRILNNDVHPVTARVKVPVLARGDEMITDTGAVSSCIRAARDHEGTESGLAAGVMWGNAFTDVPELRKNSVVVSDGDEEEARQLPKRSHARSGNITRRCGCH